MCNKISFADMAMKDCIKTATLADGQEYIIVNLDKRLPIYKHGINWRPEINTFVVEYGKGHVKAFFQDTLIFRGDNLVAVIPHEMRGILNKLMFDKQWVVDIIDNPCDADLIHAACHQPEIYGNTEIHMFDGGFATPSMVAVPVAERGNKIGIDIIGTLGGITDGFVCYGSNSNHVFCMLTSEDDWPMSRLYVCADRRNDGQVILHDRNACMLPIEIANELKKVAPLFILTEA